MQKGIYIFFLVSSFHLFTSCTKLLEEPAVKYTYKIPEDVGDGLETSTLEAEGVNTLMMEQLTDLVNTDYFKNIHSIVVVKNNKLVYEGYFNGYDRNMLHDLYSASKSFTSCLTGIAIDKEWIPDTNARILSYFPEFSSLQNDGSGKKDITVKHLLTMTSGLACDDWDPASPGGTDNLNKQKNMLDYLLHLPMVAAPGDKPHYCSGGKLALNHVLAKAAGKSYEEISRTYVFEPLGITQYKMGFRKNNQADPDMIFLRPRDMAKFGMVYLNGGKWKDKQIVSADWVKVSLETKTAMRNTDYGFLWWIHKGKLKGEDAKVYTASGNGGQFIFIVPALNLVVATTAGNVDSPYSEQGLTILYNHIFPAIQ